MQLITSCLFKNMLSVVCNVVSTIDMHCYVTVLLYLIDSTI